LTSHSINVSIIRPLLSLCIS